ncbi:MAG: hypothetical protein VX229_07470 [Pseudomonadota bacterium]|nr:hypothetical protein [Pseudomonadota bacterium]
MSHQTRLQRLERRYPARTAHTQAVRAALLDKAQESDHRAALVALILQAGANL